MLVSLRRLRTPKGLLILVFLVYLPAALLGGESLTALTSLLLASAVAVILDLAITRLRQRRWLLPDGALLTGMIVGFVLRPEEAASTVIITSSIAILSKHLLRTHWSNVLNPAALALTVAAVALDAGESWWGALPEAGLPGLVLLIGTGSFIVDRINKTPMVLVYLGLYFALFATTSLLEPGTAHEHFRTPTLQAVLFCAFFMLDDPPTSPVRYGDQVVFGAIAAVATVTVFLLSGAVYFLPAGILIANAWESARRFAWDRRRYRTLGSQSGSVLV